MRRNVLPVRYELYVYVLFRRNLVLRVNDAVTNSDYMASNNRMTINNKLEMTWNEAVVTLLSPIYVDGLRKPTENLRCCGQLSNTSEKRHRLRPLAPYIFIM
jgi:hypothetical protein